MTDNVELNVEVSARHSESRRRGFASLPVNHLMENFEVVCSNLLGITIAKRRALTTGMRPAASSAAGQAADFLGNLSGLSLRWR